QEARDLTTAFNIMQARIARHVEGRTRMLATISHDLNTPITELRLQMELLDDGPERDAVQEATVEISLTALIDDLAKRYATMGTPIGWRGASEITCRCRPLALKRALTNL
ncbi:sensor histidine kinase, partial [Pseudomonas syringae pv. actinidiae ICMP 18804]